jgi:hypothetical protein
MAGLWSPLRILRGILVAGNDLRDLNRSGLLGDEGPCPVHVSLTSPFGLAPAAMLVGLGHLTWFILEKRAILGYIVAQGD